MPIPPGPPFDLDVLADLHAGVYPDGVAAVLRARVATDPQAQATLDALDATVTDLRGLPPVPIPTQVAARLDAAIAAEVAARVSVGTAPAPSSPSPAPLSPSPAPSGPHELAPSHESPPPGAARTPFLPAPSGPAVPPPRTGAVPPPPGGTGHAPHARPHSVPPTTAGSSPPPTAPPAPVGSLDQARRVRQQRTDARRRQSRWATGLGIAAAVAAVVTIGAVVLRPGSTSGTGMAGGQQTTTSAPSEREPTSQQPPPGHAAPQSPGDGTAPSNTPGGGAGAPDTGGNQHHAVVAEPHHLDKLLPEIENSEPEGPFSNPLRLASCMAANDADSNHVLGVLPVSYAGKQAYAISVRTSQDTVRILVVGPDCGQSGADLMEDQTATG